MLNYHFYSQALGLLAISSFALFALTRDGSGLGLDSTAISIIETPRSLLAFGEASSVKMTKDDTHASSYEMQMKIGRNGEEQEEQEEPILSWIRRKLEWIFIDETIDNNMFYTYYDDDDAIPDNTSEWADSEDYFRERDLCYDEDSDTYCRENCDSIEIPDCSGVEQIYGEAKLCITRYPLPWQHETYYVGTVACIPVWENCDKCMCGGITAKGDNAYCENWFRDGSNDDMLKFDCDDMDKIKIRNGNSKLRFSPNPRSTICENHYCQDTPGKFETIPEKRKKKCSWVGRKEKCELFGSYCPVTCNRCNPEEDSSCTESRYFQFEKDTRRRNCDWVYDQGKCGVYGVDQCPVTCGKCNENLANRQG